MQVLRKIALPCMIYCIWQNRCTNDIARASRLTKIFSCVFLRKETFQQSGVLRTGSQDQALVLYRTLFFYSSATGGVLSQFKLIFPPPKMTYFEVIKLSIISVVRLSCPTTKPTYFGMQHATSRIIEHSSNKYPEECEASSIAWNVRRWVMTSTAVVTVTMKVVTTMTEPEMLVTLP